ncbi:unnamed protein product, partial [Hydatigera taeniaeformis]|uniref:Uncharacterized protein n=1 Tax=Hydatigena taeniaeformis TaxID=6205 RepID=A0A0R3X9V9_HYDTA
MLLLIAQLSRGPCSARGLVFTRAVDPPAEQDLEVSTQETEQPNQERGNRQAIAIRTAQSVSASPCTHNEGTTVHHHSFPPPHPLAATSDDLVPSGMRTRLLLKRNSALSSTHHSPSSLLLLLLLLHLSSSLLASLPPFLWSSLPLHHPLSFLPSLPHSTSHIPHTLLNPSSSPFTPPTHPPFLPFYLHCLPKRALNECEGGGQIERLASSSSSSPPPPDTVQGGLHSHCTDDVLAIWRVEGDGEDGVALCIIVRCGRMEARPVEANECDFGLLLLPPPPPPPPPPP